MSTEKKRNKDGILAFIFLIVALIYDVYPFDLVPDIPVIGWGDDILITLTAIVNLFEKFALQGNETLQSLIKKIKWGIFVSGVVVLSFIVAGVIGITGMFNFIFCRSS